MSDVSDDKVGGRLKWFLPFWKTLTHDSSILQIVSGARIEFVRPICQDVPRPPIRCSITDKSKIDSELSKYLRLGIIEHASHSDGEFISQIFSVPKKSGGVRIILNLKPLNEDVVYQHFKMENIHSVLQLLEPNCYMASIDLRDAYYSVNIHPSDRKYLRFIWNNYLYQFTCLPNGLSSAPRWFTKLLKPVFSQLRSLGFLSAFYLDDTWLMGKSKEECELNVKTTLNLLCKAGFLINTDKSQLKPSQIITFLGFELNSELMSISLPASKRFEILTMCQTLLNSNLFSIRFVARVIGKLVAALPAVQFGPLYYRHLEMDKIRSLRLSAGNFDCSMSISSEGRSELRWWIDNSFTCFNPINVQSFSVVLTTDASSLGWGAVFNGHKTGGRWSSLESVMHINELELLAILLGLQSFSAQITHSHVRVRCDNMTAVTYVNNLGGVKSPNCHRLAKKIWLWAFQEKVYISAEHLPGSDNVLADKASRVFDDNTEWSLISPVFNNINVELGPFSIDLFASRLNSKHSTYVSWKPDPAAVFVDAFSRSWVEYFGFYAFPPFSVVLKCLRKISVEEAQGTIVVPLWPTQVWFPKLMNMLIAPPLLLPKNCLFLPHQSSTAHKLSKSLRLIACPVSGITSNVKAFQMTLSQYCAPPGGPPHLSSMKSIIGSGIITVVNGKLMPCSIMK